MAIELDITNLLPQEFVVKAGDKTYKLSIDIPAFTVTRCQRWAIDMRDTPESVSDSIKEELEERAVKLAAELLHIDEAEARTLGGPARMRLINFLAGVTFEIKMQNS